MRAICCFSEVHVNGGKEENDMEENKNVKHSLYGKYKNLKSSMVILRGFLH